MERTISRKRIGSNIKALARWYGFRIGDIEKDAGVSQGYLSRLANDSKNESSPIIDLLLTASDKFKVSIDSLVSMDFNKIADSDKMRLYGFFETLLYLSNRDRLEWRRNDGKVVHDDEAVAGFVAEYNEAISFYVFQLDVNEEEVPGYSFFIKNRDDISKIVTINLPGPALYESLDQLFNCAAASTESVSINEPADIAIRCFMSENSLVIDPTEEQRKYRPLFEYLSQKDDDVVHMTFAEMEEILGFPLPVSFQRHPSFWANNENGQHHHCRAWLDAGYKTVNVQKNIIDRHMFFEKIKKT